MNKFIFLIGFFSVCVASIGQSSNKKMLFVIDSIPLLNDPEEWNPISADDIADIRVLTDKDSLKLLAKFDGITYVFTKEYRNRPDNLKRIPSLKQMEMKNGVWNFRDSAYNGKYIDYYNSGRIQNEGTLSNGKLNGELIIYFKNGIKKSVANYKEGVLHGVMNEYYKNGALMQKRIFAEGKSNGLSERYFVNGQIENEKKFKKQTRYDTLVTYYSTGKIRRITLIKNGAYIRDKKENGLGYYIAKFYQGLNTGDIKEANKNFYQIWLIDSTSTDTHFKEGMLLAKEFRFDDAIAEFDKALALEPLMREALVFRALTRIKKYKYSDIKALSKNKNETLLTLDDITSIPDKDQAKICNDVRQADYVDFTDLYVQKFVPGPILNYCQKKSSR